MRSISSSEENYYNFSQILYDDIKLRFQVTVYILFPEKLVIAKSVSVHNHCSLSYSRINETLRMELFVECVHCAANIMAIMHVYTDTPTWRL
jgi:hypothetical protein